MSWRQTLKLGNGWTLNDHSFYQPFHSHDLHYINNYYCIILILLTICGTLLFMLVPRIWCEIKQHGSPNFFSILITCYLLTEWAKVELIMCCFQPIPSVYSHGIAGRRLLFLLLLHLCKGTIIYVVQYLLHQLENTGTLELSFLLECPVLIWASKENNIVFAFNWFSIP